MHLSLLSPTYPRLGYRWGFVGDLSPKFVHILKYGSRDESISLFWREKKDHEVSHAIFGSASGLCLSVVS